MRYVAVSALSHEGLVRDRNEDSLVAGPWTLCATTTPTPQTFYLPLGEPVLVAVADGLGGHPAGDEASALAVRHLARAASTLTGEDAITAAVLAVNEAIHAEAQAHAQRAAMGTTIAGVVLTEERVFVFNVGDSRVYLFADGGLRRLSVDDNEPPGPGQRRSPVITQALGGGMGADEVVPHVMSRTLDAGARYLICSDGLTDALDEPAIVAILRGAEGGRAAFELWKATIEAGAPDNVTIVLAEIFDESD
jgi:serine/threonine protein phosphatase PrpC